MTKKNPYIMKLSDIVLVGNEYLEIRRFVVTI